MPEGMFIAITFALLLFSIKRVGFFPFPTGLILILGLSQILFALAHNGLVYFDMLDAFNYGGLRKNYSWTQGIYTSAALLSLVALTGRFDDLKGLKLDVGVLKDSSQSANTQRYIPLAILLVGVHLILFSMIVDWQKLWLHRIYLQEIVDNNAVDTLGLSISDTVMRLTPFFAILSVVTSCLLAGSRATMFKLVAGVITLCYFVLLLAFNSRSAAILPAIAAIYFFVLKLKGRWLIVPILTALTALSVTSVLIARNTYAHGLSMILTYFLMPLSNKSDAWLQVVMDFCQGIFITAESLQVTGDFHSMYKILAFSPLPSLLDGYSALVKVSEHRLSYAVPMSGVGEAINFGWPFVCVLIAEIALIVRAHLKLATSNPPLFLLCNFLIMFALYLIFSYPIRNALHFAWLGFFIVLFELSRLKLKSRAPGKSAAKSGAMSIPTTGKLDGIK
jgi:hypothetical protein